MTDGMERSSGDLISEKAKELFLLRRKISRLQAREEKLVRSIGRKKEYQGLRKICPYRKDKKLLLSIHGIRPRVIDPYDLWRIIRRRKGFSMRRDFFNLIVVSFKRVRGRFGDAFANRISYETGNYAWIDVEEIVLSRKEADGK